MTEPSGRWRRHLVKRCSLHIQYDVHFIHSPILTRVGRENFAARSEGVDQYSQSRFGHIRFLLHQA
jgi:hypothetical protein